MLVAGRFQEIERQIKMLGVLGLILLILPSAQALEKLGILLVVEVVGRQMVRVQRQRAFDGSASMSSTVAPIATTRTGSG